MSVDDGLNSRVVFQGGGDPLRFRVGEPGSKTPELTSFTGFDRNCMNPPENGESEDEDVVDDEDEDEEVEDVSEHDDLCHQLVSAENSNVHCGVDSDDKVEQKLNHLSPSGSAGRELIVTDGEIGRSSVKGNRIGNKAMIADPDDNVYHSQSNMQATQGSTSLLKDVAGKDGSWESLKAILSDPVTGALMDDAMIWPCGHSFGAGGMVKVKIMKSCYTCSQPVLEESIKPNLSLRVVVQAFRLEEDLQCNRLFKRRKEKSDQDKRSFGDPIFLSTPRSRGIQLPFSVGDRIIIKGNKRTPPRFVGRRAIVTTQCLNGWYVVKTLDNAECVKLQHCSLAKLTDDSSLPKAVPIEVAPAWL